MKKDYLKYCKEHEDETYGYTIEERTKSFWFNLTDDDLTNLQKHDEDNESNLVLVSLYHYCMREGLRFDEFSATEEELLEVFKQLYVHAALIRLNRLKHVVAEGNYWNPFDEECTFAITDDCVPYDNTKNEAFNRLINS